MPGQPNKSNPRVVSGQPQQDCSLPVSAARRV